MDQTSDIKILKEKLLSYGAEEGDLDEIIQDVNNLAIQRALKEYFLTIEDPAFQIIFNSSSESELIDYIHQNVSKLPQVSKERFQYFAEQTWSEYFDFMSKLA